MKNQRVFIVSAETTLRKLGLKKIFHLLLSLFISGLFFGYPTLVGAASPEEALRYRYQQFLKEQGKPSTTIPIQVFSQSRNNVREARIFAVLDQDFSSFAEILSLPSKWCEIFPVVLNIKACICHTEKGRPQLTFYVGRKFYEPPEDAYKLKYEFFLKALQENYLHIALIAEEGPFGTSDYLLEVEAIGIPDRTFISVHTSYRSSTVSRLATRGYLATLGHGKIGFTVIGGSEKNPEYIRGVRGVVERNAVRYYLALKAYMETRHLSPNKRYAAAAELWFDLTEQYHEQLFEMDKAEYLRTKRRERLNQLKLQKQVPEQKKKVSLQHFRYLYSE